MCGIVCVLGLEGNAESIRPTVLERARRVRHRGPDWSGCYVSANRNHILAHERLAIVGCDSGSQPLFSEDKDVVLAVNGEIYNHVELKAHALKEKHVFATESDCEVLLHLYQERGTAFLSLLNGIFAFVLFDEKRQRWIAARDHLGIVPLFMGRGVDGSWWFASELKALADVCVFFQDFPPGHFFDSTSAEGSGTKTVAHFTNYLTPWYQPRWFDDNLFTSQTLDLKAIREYLTAAVIRQLMCDVKFGVLLSGGLDSSVIAAIVVRYLLASSSSSSSSSSPSSITDETKSTRTPPSLLHSFSVGLADSPDLKAARKVSEYLNTIHHEIVVTLDELLNAVSDVIYHLETYDCTTIRAGTPMYLMARRIRTCGVKMVLSGEGSDEIFGGYLYFHKCPDEKEMQKELVSKLKSLHKFDCLRANKACAAWSIEARVPFLDKEFVDFAMNEISPRDKLCGRAAGGAGGAGGHTIEKKILRDAFKGYLPDEILYRQKEQFSDAVGYSWINTVKAYAKDRVSPAQMRNAALRFPFNTPDTPEAYYYRSIFESHFPQVSAIQTVPGGKSVACSTERALEWDESFKRFADCSGRSVQGVHLSAYDAAERGELRLLTKAVTLDSSSS